MNATVLSSLAMSRVTFDARVLLTCALATIVIVSVFARRVLPLFVAAVVRARARARGYQRAHAFPRRVASRETHIARIETCARCVNEACLIDYY